MIVAPARGSKSNRQKNLDPKLAAYCAASVAFLASGQKANAGTISYSGPEDITIVSTPLGSGGTLYTINLTGAGPLSAYTTDVTLWAVTAVAPILLLSDINGGAQAVFDSPFEAALSAGTLISSASVFDGGGANSYPMAKVGYGGDWDGVTDQYLGLTFTAGCHTYYGWAELTFPDNSGSAAISKAGRTITRRTRVSWPAIRARRNRPHCPFRRR